MGSLYIATPHATSAPYAPVEVATGTSARTLLQVAVPANASIRPFAWGVSFDGVAAADPPGVVEFFSCTASTLAGSLTSLTPDKWESGDSTAPASQCVGGAALTGYNTGTSTEGTLTSYRPIDIQQVHPQTGYCVWFIPGRHAALQASQQLRIRVTFSVSVNCVPWIVWEEPA